jgi:hypothetical protein
MWSFAAPFSPEPTHYLNTANIARTGLISIRIRPVTTVHTWLICNIVTKPTFSYSYYIMIIEQWFIKSTQYIQSISNNRSHFVGSPVTSSRYVLLQRLSIASAREYITQHRHGSTHTGTETLLHTKYELHATNRYHGMIWLLNFRHLTTLSGALLESRQLYSHSKTSHHFMVPESSLLWSQETSTDPYPEPDRCSPYLLYKINFNIVSPSTFWSS